MCTFHLRAPLGTGVENCTVTLGPAPELLWKLLFSHWVHESEGENDRQKLPHIPGLLAALRGVDTADLHTSVLVTTGHSPSRV